QQYVWSRRASRAAQNLHLLALSALVQAAQALPSLSSLQLSFVEMSATFFAQTSHCLSAVHFSQRSELSTTFSSSQRSHVFLSSARTFVNASTSAKSATIVTSPALSELTMSVCPPVG